MKLNVKIMVALGAALGGLASHAWADNAISFWSDPSSFTITFEAGSGTSGFSSLSTTDFSNAAAGSQANAISAAAATTLGWPNTSLPSYPGASWINTGLSTLDSLNQPASDSALYAVHFNWPYAATNKGKLQINYFTDNALGWRGNFVSDAASYANKANVLTEGLYLNNNTVLQNDGVGTNRTDPTDLSTSDPSLNNFSTFADPAYTSAGQLTSAGRTQELTGLSLMAGSNVLYINSSSFGSQAGLIFGATVSAPVPEPAAVSLLVLGASGLLIRRRRA